MRPLGGATSSNIAEKCWIRAVSACWHVFGKAAKAGGLPAGGADGSRLVIQ
jgi:hypothetical protein